MNFLIKIKNEVNFEIHCNDMPLVLLNSYFELRLYPDNPNIDMKLNLTSIKIYRQGYNRLYSMNGFNPFNTSFSDFTRIIQCNKTDKVSMRLLDS